MDQQWLRIAWMRQAEAEREARLWRLAALARGREARHKPAGLWLGEWLHVLAHGLIERYGGEKELHTPQVGPSRV
jgi:hypothetical protein